MPRRATRAATAGWRVGRRLHVDQSGQVSLLLVMIVLCLATLIFFVFNTGDQANQAVMAQNAADAAALAGANWLAHGYNVIAMNNVAASKIIGLMAMLESIGPSVELALPNAREILPYVEDYPERLPGRAAGGTHPDAILARALVGPIRPEDCTGLGEDEACESLADECRACIAKLEELQRLVQRLNEQFADRGGFPAALTAFADGQLWQVLRALQNFNDAVVQITPGMAERRAYDVGRGNWATFACLLPLVPDFPVRAGSWSDYHDPVMSGLPPDWQPATAEIIKGGYHTQLYGRFGAYWPPYERRDRIEVGSTTGHDTEEEGEDPDERRGDPNRVRSWIPASILNWVDAGRGRARIMEDAKGPYKVYRDDIAVGTWREMRLSGFPIIFERVSQAALDAIWNNVNPRIDVPRWETDFDEITRPPGPNDPGGLLAQRVNCAMTAWLGTRRNAREAFTGGPAGTPPGEPWTIDPWPSPPKNDQIFRGWYSHAKQSREVDFVWWGQNRVRTFFPEKFGATQNQFPPDGYEPPGTDEQGNPTGQPYWLFWRWRKWLFLGSLFDTDSHQLEGLDRLTGDKSAYFPYLLDERGGYASRHTLGIFDVLGLAYRPGWARVWGRPLQNPSPLTVPQPDGAARPVNLAAAQARVFNPTAWDLWTQDWRVKLVPAEGLLSAEPHAANLATDLDRFHTFDPTVIELDDLRPIQLLFERLPANTAALEPILNH